MSFSVPKPEKPPAPPQKREGVTSAAVYQKRTKAGSGVVSTFFGGASGEPGTVGKLGLTGY